MPRTQSCFIFLLSFTDEPNKKFPLDLAEGKMWGNVQRRIQRDSLQRNTFRSVWEMKSFPKRWRCKTALLNLTPNVLTSRQSRVSDPRTPDGWYARRPSSQVKWGAVVGQVKPFPTYHYSPWPFINTSIKIHASCESAPLHCWCLLFSALTFLGRYGLAAENKITYADSCPRFYNRSCSLQWRFS